MEDLFGNAFGLSWTTKGYRNDNAGLVHVSGGVNPSVPFPGQTSRRGFSAYRLFTHDPLPWNGGRVALYWRNGGAKCALPAPDDTEWAPAASTPVMARDGTAAVSFVESYVWWYSYER